MVLKYMRSVVQVLVLFKFSLLCGHMELWHTVPTSQRRFFSKPSTAVSHYLAENLFSANKYKSR